MPTIRSIISGLLGAAALMAMLAPTAEANTRPRLVLETVPGAAIQVVQLAMTPARDLKLKVISACNDGVAIFKVQNDGQPWPAAGTFGIYRVVDGKTVLVSRRTMRLTEGQQASFRIKKPGDDTLTLFVEPAWYQRDFTRDAEVACK